LEATRANGQFTLAEFKEAFNSKYFSERVQEKRVAEFAALKQRSLSVADYEAQFSRLARYVEHLVNTERMKAKRFLNGLRPQYITQLAPLDIQTYVEMVKKAQLLEDATDFTDCIKGKFVKKELTPGLTSAKPTNGKKHPFSITEGPSQERKLKVFVPNTPAKSNCKHCDKPGHTADECWRKVGVCVRCGSCEHRRDTNNALILGKPKDPRFHLISIKLSSFHLHLPLFNVKLILIVHITTPNIVPIHYVPPPCPSSTRAPSSTLRTSKRAPKNPCPSRSSSLLSASTALSSLTMPPPCSPTLVPKNGP
ncbi:hypothetical protein Taro_022307, partial [Colocasia esculenta]|nr:hypothetical protein [Colocasia esculenta]